MVAPAFKKHNDGLTKHQPADMIIDISDWELETISEPYKEGSRPKKIVYCPPNITSEFLIPNHRYLFKLSRDRYPEQFWIEIIAYKLGKIMGINVPPTFVAIDSKRKICAALIEWFYNYPNFPKEIFYSGRDYMRKKIINYDHVKGKQHNMETIIKLSQELTFSGALRSNWIKYWCSILLFDALIGNTDRHQDNWGLIWDKKMKRAWFSPVFDNGTAMGSEIFETNFETFNIDKHTKRGKHHLRWAITDLKSCTHIQMLQKLIEMYPISKKIIQSKLEFNFEEFCQEVFDLCSFETYVPLTKRRARFIADMIYYRKQYILGSI